MSNQARISAAIEKLERLKAESTPGPWTYRERVLGLPNTTISAGDGVHVGYATPMHATAANAHLIVTLHRTIDAQLELLRLAQKYGELDAGSGSRFIAGAVKLADAILGRG